MKMTELDHISCFAASIYIFIGFVSEKILFHLGIFFVMSADVVSKMYLGAFFFFISCNSKIFQKFHVKGICPFKMLLTKCHVLLQCSDLLLMPCDVP